ncbi:response regulator [Desulfurispirillum indicum]|uniref:Response regulator receiver n=1 Tax=Desulfurispirillum indicum (strain ATCC BAA-1389 / DSM 22839 / S5) TaxID=653733 RepID=E6W4Z0_DESIS|nr:response regulator [Desulfurispirillum indicum]ADU65966.1 response regulator receiver [Desulfurispirillum indicum S5]UCZ57903.1 response regulator [Desulfurispirillum indicum]
MRSTELKRVIVVDDEQDMLDTIRLPLRLYFQDIHTFSDSRKALDFMGSDRTPALLILDLVMPVLDGASLLEELRSQNIAHPTVILSATSDRKILERCHRSGVTHILQKPIDFSDLRSVIAGILAQY